MNRFLTIICLILLTAVYANCRPPQPAIKSNKEVIRTVKINNTFSGVMASNGIIVKFEYDPNATSTTCQIRGMEDLVDRVKPRVENETLVIATHDGWGIHYGGPADGRPTPVVTIVSPCVLRNVQCNSGATLDMGVQKMSAGASFNVNSGGQCKIGTIKGANNVEVRISSGGILTISDMHCRSINITEASSGAQFTVSGAADNVTVVASSGAKIDLRGLNIEKSLNSETSSGATILHNGSAPSVKTTKNSGSIII